MKKKTVKLERLKVLSFTTADMKNLKGGDEWTEENSDACSGEMFCERDMFRTGV
ncbi:MAG: hypothetical protein WBB45_21625 [Cyclobacteriaceae bacterium]